MRNEQETKVRGRAVQRPLLSVLGACLLGGWAATLAPHWQALLFLWGCTSLFLFRRRTAPPALFQGVPLGVLLALVALASLRTHADHGASVPTRTGIWQTLFEGDEMVGVLKGSAQRYELPRGSVHDGEWIELLPTKGSSRMAEGQVPAPGARDRSSVIKLRSDEIKRLRAAPGGWFPGGDRWRQLRDSVVGRLESIEDKSARGLAAALMFGDRGQLPPGTADLYTRTGTRHALAVSGLHVGLVASLWIWPLGACAAWALRRLRCLPGWLLRWARPELFRVLMLLTFIPLAGAGAPVIRASLALCLVSLAELLPTRGVGRWKRLPDALSTWAFAALLEWCAGPGNLLSLSMQLSYVATLGLILFTGPLYARLKGYLPGGGQISGVWSSGRPRPPWLRLAFQKALNWTLGGLAASFAASAATLPIVWFTFGEWSLAGPFATLWLLPWLAIFMGLAWLRLVWPTEFLGDGLSWITHTMESGLHFFDGWPGTPMVLPMRPGELLFLAGASLLAAGALRSPWNARALRVSAGAWGLALLPWWNGPRGAELYLVDVGHGTAAVIRLPGAGTWLFDAGSRDRVGVARYGVAPLLRKLDSGDIHVALSHGESDHAGALPWLIERFPPGLWLGSLPASIAARLPESVRCLDTERGRLELQIGPANAPVRLSLLRGMPGSGNEGSRSLEVCFGGTRWLLCGDAEGRGLARQLRTDLFCGPYDLVLFPHHGSETPWLAEFLEATDPGVIWFSSSGRPPVADELDRRGIPWASTADAGPLRWRAIFEGAEPVQKLGEDRAAHLTAPP